MFQRVFDQNGFLGGNLSNGDKIPAPKENSPPNKPINDQVVTEDGEHSGSGCVAGSTSGSLPSETLNGSNDDADSMQTYFDEVYNDLPTGVEAPFPGFEKSKLEVVTEDGEHSGSGCVAGSTSGYLPSETLNGSNDDADSMQTYFDEVYNDLPTGVEAPFPGFEKSKLEVVTEDGEHSGSGCVVGSTSGSLRSETLNGSTDDAYSMQTYFDEVYVHPLTAEAPAAALTPAHLQPPSCKVETVEAPFPGFEKSNASSSKIIPSTEANAATSTTVHPLTAEAPAAALTPAHLQPPSCKVETVASSSSVSAVESSSHGKEEYPKVTNPKDFVMYMDPLSRYSDAFIKLGFRTLGYADRIRPRRLILHGMLLAVESRMFQVSDYYRMCGYCTGDLDADKDWLREVRTDIEMLYPIHEIPAYSEAELRCYLSRFTERAIKSLQPDAARFVEENSGQVIDYLVDRLPNLKFYRMVVDDRGMIVFGDFSIPHTPEFLYLIYGLKAQGNYCDDIPWKPCNETSEDESSEEAGEKNLKTMKIIWTGGKSYVRSPPVFSSDTRKLLVPTGNTVSVFSSSTGLLESELKGHTAAVTSAVVVPGTLRCNCWTASLDGTVKFWEFLVPSLIKTITIGSPIHSMVIPGLVSTVADENLAYIFVEAGNEYAKKQRSVHYQIRKVNLNQPLPTIREHFRSCPVTLVETDKQWPIVASPSGNYIGICNRQTLYIWEVPRRDADNLLREKIKLHHTEKLTTLAFHPTKRIVAAGDVTGRILIWRNFSKGKSTRDGFESPGGISDDDADSCTTWHWHSAQVNMLFFPTDGGYLYSGGNERIIVRWQLDTGKEEVLQCFEAPLRYFATSNTSLSSVSCSDNRIHLLQMPSMEILHSITGIKPPSKEIAERPCSRVVVSCSSGVAAVPTESCGVQLFSLLTDREVQVCERNHQPGDEVKVKVVVEMVSVSPDGSDIATAVRRFSEKRNRGLVSLSFWEFNSQSKYFSLSTVVDKPHRRAGVSGLAFHPTRKMAVSLSCGAYFKTWECVSKEDEKNKWTSRAIGSYKNKQISAAAFSADGSVLAFAAENVIITWDPEQNHFLRVIGESTEPIVSLTFVGKSDHLVSASRGSHPELSLWSLSKLSASWSYKLQAEAVSCASDSSSFAVLSLLPQSSSQGVDGLISLFEVDKVVPVSSWFVKKAKGGTLGFFRANSTSPEFLAYINGEHEYAILGHDDIVLLNLAESRTNFEETRRQFGHRSIYGNLPEFKLNFGRSWEAILDADSGPPLSPTSTAFLEALLERKKMSYLEASLDWKRWLSI